MEPRELTSKERNQLQAWSKFCEEENGAVPATIAAMVLRMTTNGLYQAAERGWIKFFRVGRDRWYGRKSVSRYRAKRDAGGNWTVYRAPNPRDCSETGGDDFGEWTAIQK